MQLINPKQIDIASIALKKDELTDAKFREWLYEKLDYAFLQRYNIFKKDFITKSDLKEAIDKCIITIRNTYFEDRRPNKEYSQNEITNLPYSPNYYIECININYDVNDGKTDDSDLLGLPEFYDNNGNVIEDPSNKTFVDGGITWKVRNKLKAKALYEPILIKLSGDVQAQVTTNFENEDGEGLNISVKILSATNMHLNGNTIVNGTITHSFDSLKPTNEYNTNVVTTMDYPNAIKYSENSKVVSKGIAIADDAVICNADTPNHLSIRGSDAALANSENIGGILFGAYQKTGITGDKQNLTVTTAESGAVLPATKFDSNGNVIGIVSTSLGAEDAPYEKVYTKELIVVKADNSDEQPIINGKITNALEAETIKEEEYKEEFSEFDRGYVLGGNGEDTTTPIFSRNIYMDFPTNTLHTENLVASGQIDGIVSKVKAETTKTTDTKTYLSQISGSGTTLKYNTNIYANNSDNSIHANKVVATTFEGNATKVKADATTSATKAYILGTTSTTGGTTPIYDADIYFNSSNNTVHTPNLSLTGSATIPTLNSTKATIPTINSTNITATTVTATTFEGNATKVKAAANTTSTKVYVLGTTSTTGGTTPVFNSNIYFNSTNGALYLPTIIATTGGTIPTLTSTTGNITTLTATTINNSAGNLTSKNITVSNKITSKDIETDTFKATTGTIATLNSTTSTIGTLNVTTKGTIKELGVTNNITVGGNVTAAKFVGNLEGIASKIKAVTTAATDTRVYVIGLTGTDTTVKYNTGIFLNGSDNSFNAGVGKITTLTSTTGNITTVNSTTLKSATTAATTSVTTPTVNSNVSSSWIDGFKGKAAINLTSEGSTYKGVFTSLSPNGRFTLATYGSDVWMSYQTNASINTGTNASPAKQNKLLDESGNMTCCGNLKVDGTVSGAKVTNAVYNDYAELFPKGEETEVGDIIMLDLNSDEEKYIKAFYDPNGHYQTVVGVHSGEYAHLIGGEQPPEGVDLEEYNKENYIPIGLAGRCKVKIIGRAVKGNLVVPSTIPGVGMCVPINSSLSCMAVGYLVESDNNNDNSLIRLLKVKLK